MTSGRCLAAVIDGHQAEGIKEERSGEKEEEAYYYRMICEGGEKLDVC